MSEFIEILSPNAEAQLKAIMPLVEELANNIKTINGYKASSTPSGSDKGIQGLNNAYKEQTKELDEIKKRLLTITSLNKQRYQEEAKLIADNDKALTYQSQKELTQIKAKQAMITSLNKQKEQEVIVNEKLSNVYNKIQSKVNSMIPVYNNLQAKQAIGLTLSSKEEAQLILLTNRLNKYQEVLKGTDIAIGRHGREVGNYSKANGNLAFSISQISRELPNFGQSFQIGVLSLTNNVGFLLDSVKQVREENEILKKAGQSTQSVFKQILGSIFSWQTLLFVGIGLISAYSTEIKDFTVELFKGAKGFETLKDNQKALSESFKKGNEEASKEVSTLKTLYETATNENLTREQRIRAVDKMQELYPLYLKNFSDEEILAGKAQVAYENLTDAIFNKARASAIEGELQKRASERINKELELEQDILKARKEYNEQLKNPKKLTSTTSDIYGSNDNVLANEKEYTKILEQNLKTRKQKLDDFVKGSKNNDNLLLKQAESYYKDESELAENAKIVSERETPKQKADRLKREAKERADELKKFTEKAIQEREQLLKDQYDAELSNLERQKEVTKTMLDNEETSLEDRLFLLEAYAFKEVQIAQFVHDEKVRLANKEIEERKLKPNSKEAQNLITPIDNELFNKQNDIVKNGLKEREKIQKEDAERTKAYYDKNPPFFILTKEQKEQIDDDNKRILDAKKQSLKDAAKLFNDFAGDFAQGSGFNQTFDSFFKEDKNGVSIFDTMFDKDSMMSAEDRSKATFLAISSAFQDTMNLMSSASMERFDKEYASLEKEKEVRLKFAGDSDSAKQKIEEYYEKRRKEIAVREFKAKQKLALANIAIDIAQGIAATIGKGGFFASPLAIAVAAIGAIQLAAVASQKPPEYWKGTDNAEAGLAWTNERGAEIVTDKAGHIKDFGSDGGAKLTMMEKGDKVYNAQQTKKLMFNNELNSIMMDNGIGNAPQIVVNSGMTKIEMREIMMETLGSMSQESTIIDSNGFKRVISNGHSKTITNNNRVSGRGIRV